MFPVLCAVFLRDALNTVVDIDPRERGPFDFRWSEARIKTRPDERWDFPAVGTLPIVWSHR